VFSAVSDRVRIRRGPAKGRYDRAALERVLDRGRVAHVAIVADEAPLCIPMLYARVAGQLYVHGSIVSRLVRQLADGAPACVAVTNLQGFVLARSAFEHSANYESAVVFGAFAPVVGDDARLAAFEAFTEKLLPGRWAEIRPPSAKELKASAILALDLAASDASVKIRSGPPDDDDSADADLEVWAGVLSLVTACGAPVPAPGLRPDVTLAPSVSRFLEEHRWG
jgi:uncharacterized protein